MRVLDVFSGIGAGSLGFEMAGHTIVGHSEIEAFPSAVLKHHWPEVPNYGDITKFHEWPSDIAPDLIIGGSPCFPSETLILTDKGYTHICDVRPGDVVLTHMGRWRRVLNVGCRVARTITLRGQGCPDMVTTHDHPFLACKRVAKSTRRDGKAIRLSTMLGPEWVRAADMHKRHWGMIAHVACTPVPEPELHGRESVSVRLCADLMWLAGAYVGNGWVRINDRRGAIIFGVNAEKSEQILHVARRLGLACTTTRERTTIRIAVHGRSIARWMVENFGSMAHKKHIPAWLFGAKAEWRTAFLHGLHAMDGTRGKNMITTTSRKLRVGLVTLIATLGHVPSVHEVAPRPWKIKGRSGMASRYWVVRWHCANETRTTKRIGWVLFGCVRSVREDTMRLVWNIEVEEDNSYVADGIVVHNCQSFSTAGLRLGLADPRGSLMLTYLVVIRRYLPRWVVWENVPGALSADGGRAFATLLHGLAQCGYHAAWRVLDAQHVRIHGFCRAVPQRRRRVFVVGHLGDWRRAAAVLFDRESGARDPAPGGRTWEEAAENAAPGAGSRCVANTLTRRMHKGINSTVDEGQTPIVVNARQDPVFGDKPGALDTDGGTHAVTDGLAVRRLTPLECERLQGFPDGWTAITFRGKPASDTARYKALGNAMAVNVVRWIAERINMVEAIT